VKQTNLNIRDAKRRVWFGQTITGNLGGEQGRFRNQNKAQTKEAGVPYSIDISLVPAAISRPYHNKVTLYALPEYETKSLRGIASRVGG